ncbi:MAG: hypothetical protein R3F30_12175 [Planctomycetota bacterium]
MAKVEVGQKVFVAQSRLSLRRARPNSIVECEVVGTRDRSAIVSLPGERDQEVATSLLLLNAQQILVLSIGDLSTERTLIEPLTKSTLQFLRLLLTDDFVTQYRLRSVNEFSQVWAKEHALYNWILVIGHGSKQSLSFAVDGSVPPERFRQVMEAHPPKHPVSILSLACETGCADFAKHVAESAQIARFIAPFHSVHGAVASHFAQTFFTNHFLEGYTAWKSFRRSRSGTPDGTRFRYWDADGLHTP